MPAATLNIELRGRRGRSCVFVALGPRPLYFKRQEILADFFLLFDFTCLICCNQTHFAFSVGYELVDPSFESVLWKFECFRHALVVSVCDVRLLSETPDDST